MQFDFDMAVNRRTINSLKWDVAENELPMWVADMDFMAAPAIREALIKRVEKGTFGYEIVPDSWYEAIGNWWKRRHGIFFEKEWLTFCTGVVPAISSAVKRLTNIGDNVLVQTPVYDIFFHSVENGGRHVLENKLHYDGSRYSIDFSDLEEKLAQPLTTMMILCNPHNPVGKIWTKEELTRIGGLCKKYGVTVLSDEIHCDMIDPGSEYVPFAAASKVCADISMTCISASKAFNIAGLQTAAVMIPNKILREKVVRGLNSDELAEPNSFAIDAAVAAFNEGEEWLDELRDYLQSNKKIVREFIEENLSMLKVVSEKATYLLWIDCSAVTNDTDKLCDYIQEKTGLIITAGGQYRGDSDKFVRINTACTKDNLNDGMQRLKASILSYNKK